MIWLQFLVVIVSIFWGVRLGGIGLGVMGGLGLCLLTFVFRLEPTSPPIDVMLMILAVVTATSALQTAGGMDVLVRKAEHILRNNPQQITYLGPVVTFFFTLFSGTGHVAYSILPVISEVAKETGIRPERPLSVAVIASQQAITASPISAATVALLGLTAASEGAPELIHILMICIPSTLCGILLAAFVANRSGKELHEDPVYLERLKQQKSSGVHKDSGRPDTMAPEAVRSVFLFLAAISLVILFGACPSLRQLTIKGKEVMLSMADVIEMVMLSATAFILTFCKVSVSKIPEGGIFKAGMQAVIAIFGIAWLGDTFFAGNSALLEGSIKDMVRMAPWAFSFALFALSVLLFSQAATVRALMPFGLALGISPALMVAMFPAVNGYFMIPNYPTIVAAIQFDETGTTRVGKYLFNHSFMIPGLIATTTAVLTGLLLSSFIL